MSKKEKNNTNSDCIGRDEKNQGQNKVCKLWWLIWCGRYSSRQAYQSIITVFFCCLNLSLIVLTFLFISLLVRKRNRFNDIAEDHLHNLHFFIQTGDKACSVASVKLLHLIVVIYRLKQYFWKLIGERSTFIQYTLLNSTTICLYILW